MRAFSPEVPCILLFRGRGLISRLIRWQTRSVYSHAAIMTRAGTIIEAWHRGGVREKNLSDYRDIDFFVVPDMSPEQWDRAIAFARGQLGKRYDYLGVIRFVTRRRHLSSRRMFCSELVFAALAAAGVGLLKRIPAPKVSPAMLALSPLLIRTNRKISHQIEPS